MKKFSFLLAMAFAALSFFACKNDISTVTETGTSGEKASIRVGSVSSRSIYPATVKLDDFSSFVLTGVFEDEKVDLLTAADATTLTASSVEVTCGDWEFTLSASLDGETFSDTISKTISHTETNTLSFTLAAESTTGSINLSISFTNTDVVKVIASLTNSSGTSATEIPYYLEGSADATADSYTFSENDSAVCTFNFEETGLEAGDYILYLYFYADGINEPINKPYHVIKVLPGITTQVTLKMIVNDVYTVSFVDNLNELTTDSLKYYCKTGTIILPTLEKDGYTFAGWSKSSDATEIDCAGGEELSVSKGNIVLYAVWYDSEVSGDFTISDGLIDISISHNDSLYMNVGTVTLGGKLRTDGSDISTSTDVTWTAELYYGNRQINSYGTEFTSVTQADGTNAAYMTLDNLLETGGNYQLYVTATYESATDVKVTSSQVFDLTFIGKEYYEYLDLEDSAPLSATTISDDLSAITFPALVVVSGSDTSVFSSLTEYLPSAANYVEVDASGITGFTELSDSLSSTNLRSIILPDTITSIGDAVFNGCTNLESVELPDSLTSIGTSSFNNCSALTSVTIPEKVTTIGATAFSGCSTLTSINIPAAVTSIGNKAFAACTSLSEITVEDGNENYESRLDNTLLVQKSMTVSLSDGSLTGSYEGYGIHSVAAAAITSLDLSDDTSPYITIIGDGAFYGDRALTTIKNFGNITCVGNSAFYGCTALTDISDFGVVSTICPSAFYNAGLTTIPTIGLSSSITIGSSAFANTSLTELTFGTYAPMVTTDTSAGIFAGCSDLTSVTINFAINETDEIYTYTNSDTGQEVSVYSEDIVHSMFYNGPNNVQTLTLDGVVTLPDITNDSPYYMSEDATFYGLCNTEELNMTLAINGGGSSIGAYQFMNCPGIEHINISGSNTTIGDYAFKDVGYLTDLYLSGVSTIGEYAFAECTSLTSLDFSGSTDATVGRCAFYECTALEDISLTGVKYIYELAFYKSVPTEITIPSTVVAIGPGAFADASSENAARTDLSVTIEDTTGTWYYIYATSSVNSVTLATGDTQDCAKAWENLIEGSNVPVDYSDGIATADSANFITYLSVHPDNDLGYYLYKVTE